MQIFILNTPSFAKVYFNTLRIYVQQLLICIFFLFQNLIELKKNFIFYNDVR